MINRPYSFKILVFSDIHMRILTDDETKGINDYKGTDAKIKNFISHKTLLDNHPTFLSSFIDSYVNQEIKYIVINGDLAFQGIKAEYDDFKNYILNPILSKTENAPVICSAGNHDIISDLSIGTNGIEKISNDTLKAKYGDYSNFVNKGNYISSLDIYNVKFVNYNSYSDLGLFGIIYDKSNKIAFVVLNSTFNSYGPVVSKIIENFIKSEEYTKLPVEKKAREILNLFNRISDYGNQELNEDLFDVESFINEIKRLKLLGFRIITMTHIPPNWYKWNKKFTYDYLNETFLSNITNLTDLFITSHEHEESKAHFNILSDECIHLRTGMLLPDKVFKYEKDSITWKENFTQSTMSIVKITDGEVIENRYQCVYNETSNNDNIDFNWIDLGPNKRPIKQINERLRNLESEDTIEQIKKLIIC